MRQKKEQHCLRNFSLMPLHHFTYGLFAHHTTSHNSLNILQLPTDSIAVWQRSFHLVREENYGKKYCEGKICGRQVIMKSDILRI